MGKDDSKKAKKPAGKTREKQVRKAGIILAIGMILTFAVFMKEQRSEFKETEFLTRNPYGEGEKTVTLIAESDWGREEISFDLEEKEGAEGTDEEEEGIIWQKEERSLSPKEEFREELISGLMKEEYDSRDQELFRLPGDLAGHAITWRIKQKRKAPMLAGLSLMLAVLVYLLPIMAEDKKEKERRQRIREEYPNLAFRLSMLLSAGLTTRQAWERLLAHYEKQPLEAVLYGEVRTTCLEIRNGVPEARAYENLSRRCGNKEITRLCALLSQGIRRGSGELSERIREEAREALKNLSDGIRRENETVGTKLLLPTMVLLLIVMVIVMLPAFSML